MKGVVTWVVATLFGCHQDPIEVREQRYCAPNQEQAKWILGCINGFSGSAIDSAHHVTNACEQQAQTLVGECSYVPHVRLVTTWMPCHVAGGRLREACEKFSMNERLKGTE